MIKIAGGVVWNPQYGITVVSQRHNSWSLPKGHVEEGEDILAGAVREIYEETGIPMESLILKQKLIEYERTKIKRDPNEPDELRTITLFLFHTAWNHLSPIDPENPEARWVPIDKVSGLLTHEKDKQVFITLIPEILKSIE